MPDTPCRQRLDLGENARRQNGSILSDTALAPPAGQTAKASALGRHVIHGRRHGPKLRAKRRHLLETMLPDLTIHLPAACTAPSIAVDRLFTPPLQQTWLEIGFGAGEHLIWQARAHPHVGMIGCEPFINGVARVLSQIHDQQLTNIRLFPDDARPLIDHLPRRCLDRVFVLFPDPWPKRRHHKRRLFNVGFLDSLGRVMKPGAMLRVATDHQAYLRWILAHLSRHSAFQWTARGPQDWCARTPDWPETRYEKKARAVQRPCLYLSFLRRGD